jgi:hypothetical protein
LKRHTVTAQTADTACFSNGYPKIFLKNITSRINILVQDAFKNSLMNKQPAHTASRIQQRRIVAVSLED